MQKETEKKKSESEISNEMIAIAAKIAAIVLIVSAVIFKMSITLVAIVTIFTFGLIYAGFVLVSYGAVMRDNGLI